MIRHTHTFSLFLCLYSVTSDLIKKSASVKLICFNDLRGTQLIVIKVCVIYLEWSLWT